MRKLIIGLFLFSSNLGVSQQIEVDFFNTISLLRIYKANKNTEPSATNGGGVIDAGRNSLLVQLYQPFHRVGFDYGLAYSVNKYSFGVGDSHDPNKQNPLYRIFEKYQCVSLIGGIKKRWSSEATFFCLSFDLFPSFIISQSGYLYSRTEYENINSKQFGLSHIDSRLNMSIQFGKDNDIHFVFNWFFQPPSIYTGNYIRGKISSVNMGIGIGVAFDTKKNE